MDQMFSELPSSRPWRWIGRLVAVLFIANGLLALWSLTVGQFVASPFGQMLSLVGMIGFATAMGSWTYVDPVYKHDTPERAERLARAPALANPALRVPFIAVFTGLMAYEACGAIFEFWTLALGGQGEQIMHLGSYRNSSRHNCAGFELQEAPLKLHRIVCRRYHDDEAPPPGTPVVVRGQVSPLGIRVEQFVINPGP